MKEIIARIVCFITIILVVSAYRMCSAAKRQ